MKRRPYIFLFIVGLTLVSCSKVPVPSEVNLSVNSVSSFSIHTEEQKLLLESEDPNALILSDITYGRRSLSTPNPLHLSWTENNDINQNADRYEVFISEDNAFTSPLKYTVNDLSADIFNLKINTKYYGKVNSIHASSIFTSDVFDFTINDVTPRNIYVDGVENVRDLGGWKLTNNKIYKQGLIYRTAQFNYGGGLNTYKSAPTEKGVNTLLNELKIKTEIDLRKTKAFCGEDEVNGITSSPLGDSVTYVSCPMIYGGQNIFTREENKNSVKLFFETLSDINNYPIAFHCLRGTDRTGGLAYALGALVGMSESDLKLDYLFSDMANIGTPVNLSHIDGEDFYIHGINNSEGSSLSEKAKNYLMNTCDVSASVIDTVVDILTD